MQNTWNELHFLWRHILRQVDVHVMTNPTSGEWEYFGTEVTDGNGRCVYRIPQENKLVQGMYPVKMVVR